MAAAAPLCARSKGLLLAVAVALLFLPRKGLCSIDCYTCSSRNGSLPACDDPMSPAEMELQRRCTVPKENHVGKFPANFCIKMVGTSETTGATLVVRTCSLEDLNSQCGGFKFQNDGVADTLEGCLLTCDYDGCNTGSRPEAAAAAAAALALSVAATAVLA